MTLPDTANSLIDPKASSWADATSVFGDTHTWLSMRVIFAVSSERSP